MLEMVMGIIHLEVEFYRSAHVSYGGRKVATSSYENSVLIGIHFVWERSFYPVVKASNYFALGQNLVCGIEKFAPPNFPSVRFIAICVHYP